MPNLLFCLTPGGSLAQWEHIGTLEREIRLYADYARMGWQVKVLTFKKESASAYGLPSGITAVRLPHARLLPVLALLRPDLGIWADVIKTNQSAGSWDYVRAARWWRKPILLRCGNVVGERLEILSKDADDTARYKQKEGWAFRNATHCQVPTRKLALWVQKHYAVHDSHILLVPNFVEIDRFRPTDTKCKDTSVISVGRFASEKRFDTLILACAQAHVSHLTLIGDGPERGRLEQLVQSLNLTVNFLGRVPHQDLPELLNCHQVYAQVSSWEGHPKSLIEAMSCALPCLVSDSPGLREQIEHGMTGWVTGSTVESIADGLITLINNERLRARLGSAARAQIVAEMAYETIRARELKTLLDMAALRNHE